MSLTASVFIEEDTSPMVDTNNSRSSAPFEIIRPGHASAFARVDARDQHRARPFSPLA